MYFPADNDCSVSTHVEEGSPRADLRVPSRLASEASAMLPSSSKCSAVLVLHCIAFCPLLSMVIFITGMHNVFIAMLVMHWLCMGLLPAVYLYFLAGDLRYYREFFYGQGLRIRKQWKIAILGFVVFAAVVYCAFWIAKCNQWNKSFCVHMRSKALEEGFKIPLWSLLLFGSYFIIVNPVVEECFWRLFLYRELGGHMFVHPGEQIFHPSESAPLLAVDWQPTEILASPGTSETIPYTAVKDPSYSYPPASTMSRSSDSTGPRSMVVCHAEPEEGPQIDLLDAIPDCSIPVSDTEAASRSFTEPDVAGVVRIPSVYDRKDLHGSSPTLSTGLSPSSVVDSVQRIPPFRDIRLTVLGQFYLSILYGSYHFCVIFHLLGILYAMIVFVALVHLGVLLIFFRNQPRTGMFTSMLVHAGVDFGAVMAYATIFFNVK